ncbi:hypothetical protein GCM10009422_05070 [Brevundimonas kwangchunensis]|uniref:Lipoprotein n=1 Tax=Brevundimonas kwangchunensis TaxID=322163 RepID=A0ABP3RM55_9CAUL
MRTSIAAGLGLLVFVAACAPTTAPGGSGESTPRAARQCFSANQVDNFRSGTLDQLFLRVSRDKVYELSVAGGCRDLDYALHLGLVADTGASSRFCTGDWARVVVPGNTQRTDVCRVRIVKQLTDAEFEALPAAHRP